MAKSKQELRAALEHLNVEYDPNATAAQLEAVLDQALESATAPQDPVAPPAGPPAPPAPPVAPDALRVEQGKVGALEQKVNELSQSLSSANATNSRLQGENERLAKEHAAATNEAERLRSEVAKLNATLAKVSAVTVNGLPDDGIQLGTSVTVTNALDGAAASARQGDVLVVVPGDDAPRKRRELAELQKKLPPGVTAYAVDQKTLKECRESGFALTR